jgi:ABC-type transport system substrate-binding protein
MTGHHALTARAAERVATLILAAWLLAPCGCRGGAAGPAYAPGPALEGPRHRGGHVVLTREEDPDFLDPALSYGIYTYPMNAVVFRTLIGYAHQPGPAGARLVPELAESLPEVREGGTLYCMKVRADARFGAPLHRHITAEDFRYSIQRLFRVNCPGVTFYRHVVGAEDMLAGRDSTLAGVIAHGDSLYIRITQPDATFKYLIAMPFISPIPPEVDRRWPNAFSQHTVSSGPYQFAEFVPRRHAILVRNPDYFGTPGWLDTIEVRFNISSTSAVAMIRRGLADGGFFEVPAADFARLRTDSLWSRQIDLADGLNTEYLWMNVRMKPFNDVRVRQAVAWALDRRAILKMWSGKGEIAGEFLSPGMPGVQRLGRYDGPDTARARALLREAGYPNGFSTTLYGWMFEPSPRELALIQQQLATVGIRARLDVGETAGYTSMAGDTTRHIPFGIYSWYADYVDPSNFFDTLLNGHRIEARHNQNLGLFDDSGVNAAIELAMKIENDDERARAYTAIDQRVMDLAPVAPTIHNHDSRLYNPRLGGWYRHVTIILRLEDLYLKPPLAPPLATAGKEAR